MILIIRFSIVIFLCSITFVYSQNKFNYKAISELSYKTDSTGSYKKSQLVLLINDNKDSFFQDYKSFKNDSINSDIMIGIGAFIREIVYVNNTKQKIKISRDFDNANVYYTESIPNQWKITNTESSVNGLKCREATLKAYGRNWTACYSEDYPFQFGPYFFAGLPGLILSVEDDQKFYQFKLQTFKQENNVINNFANGVDVSKVKFYEMVYDSDFTGNFFNKFRMENSSEQEKIRKMYIERKKKENNFPIDKSMRYLFNR